MLASRAVTSNLLFEKILERLACVIRPDRGETRGSRRGRNGYRRGSRIFLDGGAECVKGALVSSIFLSNPLRYGPGAFELRRSIEICALLAAVKLESATRTSALGVEPRLQHGAAIGTTRTRDCAHHTRSPRANLFLARAMFGWALFFLFRGIGLHVAPVAILPLQKIPPGDRLMITRKLSSQRENTHSVAKKPWYSLRGKTPLPSQTIAVSIEKNIRMDYVSNLHWLTNLR